MKPGTALSWPVRKGLRCALGLALLPSLARADSVLSPAGPIGRGDAIIMMNALAIMLAIVVPTMIATLAFAWWYRASNTRAVYRPEFTYSGKIELIVWSIPTPRHLLSGRRDLDRQPPARSFPAAAVKGQAARNRGRLFRLEMAFHLSRAADRQRQPPRHSRRPAAALPHHFGVRVQRVLRAPTGQHDLCHERHDQLSSICRRTSPEPISAFRHISAATVFPTCGSIRWPCRSTICRLGRGRQRRTARSCGSRHIAETDASAVRPIPIAESIRRFSTPSPREAAARRRARKRAARPGHEKVMPQRGAPIMLGKLGWDAIPVRPADPARSGAVVIVW